MAQLNDVVRIVGPTSVQDLLVNNILVKVSPKTRNIFVPVSQNPNTSKKGKVLKTLKSFEEV